jgi:hypothetical protein
MLPHRSLDLYKNIAITFESAMHEDTALTSDKWPRQAIHARHCSNLLSQAYQKSLRLFVFRHSPANAEPPIGLYDPKHDKSFVRVDLRADEQSPDLLTCLTNLLSSDSPSGPEVIFNTSEVIAFQLARHEPLPSYSGAVAPPRIPFRYPKELYLDQFLKENYEVASDRRVEQRRMLEEIQALNMRKTVLTHFKVRSLRLHSRARRLSNSKGQGRSQGLQLCATLLRACSRQIYART